MYNLKWSIARLSPGAFARLKAFTFNGITVFALEPARDHHGMIIGVKGVALDISDLHTAQDQFAT